MLFRSFPNEDFGETFNYRVTDLRGLLKQAKASKIFWSNPSGYVSGVNKRYHVFSLSGKQRITPSKISLSVKSGIIIDIKEVFGRKAFWPFLEDTDETEVVVRPRGSSYSDIPEVFPESMDLSKLEKTLESNPLALAKLKQRLEDSVVPGLKEKVDCYIDCVAKTAMEVVRKEYENVKARDKSIQQIEEEWNPESAKGSSEDFGATRPVVPAFEPDPGMANIHSYEDRVSRNSSLGFLARCMDDLDRTGLAKYNIPIEIPLRAGQKEVFNLVEYSEYIRNVLELSTKKLV